MSGSLTAPKAAHAPQQAFFFEHQFEREILSETLFFSAAEAVREYLMSVFTTRPQGAHVRWHAGLLSTRHEGVAGGGVVMDCCALASAGGRFFNPRPPHVIHMHEQPLIKWVTTLCSLNQ